MTFNPMLLKDVYLASLCPIQNSNIFYYLLFF